MTPPNLTELAERVEKEHPSQELNADIWLATRVGFSARSFNHWARMQPKGSKPTELEYARDRAPNFSGSLDAAITLRLDWMSVEMMESAPEPQFTRCRVWD